MASEPHAHYKKDLSHTTWDEVWARQEKRSDLADAYWRLAGVGHHARVAEVGCGPGYFALRHARRTTERVVATDVSAEAITFLRSRAGPANVEAIVHDAQVTPPPGGPFDVAFVTDVLHHMDDPARALRNLREVAARLVIAEFDPSGDASFGPPVEERLARVDVERMLEAAGWHVEEWATFAHDHYACRAVRA